MPRKSSESKKYDCTELKSLAEIADEIDEKMDAFELQVASIIKSTESEHHKEQ